MKEFWVVTMSLFILSVVTRAAPFMIKNLITVRIDKLGKRLPAFIMMLLVVYEVNIEKITHYPYGMPALAALSSVVLVQLIFRNTFVSLFAGTSVYLFILSYL